MLEHGDQAYIVNPEFHESKVRLNTGYTTSIADTEETSDTSDVSTYYTDFLHVFSEEEAGILASHGDHDHGIDIEPGKSPPLKLIYPLSQTELRIVWEYIQQVLDKEWIQPLTSPAGVSILFILKKDDGLYLCVNYYRLNAVTLKNCYLISLVNEIIDHLLDIMIFTQLDLQDAYHQI